MASYTSEYPAVEFDPAYKQFFEDFYKISDTPDVHDTYAASFTEDATLIMASRTAKGTSEILALRKGMWEKISSRLHKPIQIFPFGPNSDDVMLHGTVKYSFRAGGEAGLEWAARAHLVRVGGQVKMDFYQVYLDTAAQQRK